MLDELAHKIAAKRIMFTIKPQSGSDANITELQNHSTSYLNEFNNFCKATIENVDIEVLEYELAEVCK